MNTKGTKWSQNIPQSHKIFQIAIKYINTLTTQGPQKFTQFFFWFENKPSGNPAPPTRLAG
jgi:hypothetical protein